MNLLLSFEFKVYDSRLTFARHLQEPRLVSLICPNNMVLNIFWQLRKITDWGKVAWFFCYTPLSWFIVFVVGKLVFVPGGFQWKHISLLATAAAYSHTSSQQMCLDPGSPSRRPISLPNSHLPDRLPSWLLNKWSLLSVCHCWLANR